MRVVLAISGLLVAVGLAAGCSGSSGGSSGGGYCAQTEAFLTRCGFGNLLDNPVWTCTEPTSDVDRCGNDCALKWSCDTLVAVYCDSDLDPVTQCLAECDTPQPCGDGSSYDLSDRCDGYEDCSNGADEANCPTFQCANGEQIPADDECDGYPDCSDDSDEHCPESLFQCGGGETVNQVEVCDGTADCSNGSDEPPACETSSVEAACAKLGK